MTALPFTRRRPSPRTIDLTAFRLVEPCPAGGDDTDTRPRPAPAGVAFWGRNLLFWACFGVWIGFLLKVWG